MKLPMKVSFISEHLGRHLYVETDLYWVYQFYAVLLYLYVGAMFQYNILWP